MYYSDWAGSHRCPIPTSVKHILQSGVCAGRTSAIHSKVSNCDENALHTRQWRCTYKTFHVDQMFALIEFVLSGLHVSVILRSLLPTA